MTAHAFTARRRIEFVDTDMGGIVHFSRFFIFMETAEHEFLESLGTSVHLDLDGRKIGWPRVAVSCEYKSPARFGDVLRIEMQVLRKGRSSMTYGFSFFREGHEGIIASGKTTAVCCDLEPGQPVRPTPIPDFIAEKIVEAPGT